MAQTMYCPNCTKRKETAYSEITGLICCTGCGKVLVEQIFSTEPTFVKNSAGQSQLAGNFVKSVQSEYSASRERTLLNAEDAIRNVADNLGVDGGDQIVRPALRFYTIALERNFTRGRRVDQVAAACLYIACRENRKPFLLIEFSEFLRVNVYVLGAVFLELCKILRLVEHPIIQKQVDPSLFIHRFTNTLLGGMNREVEKTALHIIANMKRDWMQTGRKPSGICGAALYVSALSHGVKVSKSDIVKIVHICEATLTKRLIEFEDTESGSLTVEELNQQAEDYERNYRSSKHGKFASNKSKEGELLCEHWGSGEPHFAHGLCEGCYDEFIKISGGLEGGAEPPAFQRAEKERMAKACDGSVTDSSMEPGELQLEDEMRKLDGGGNERLETKDSEGVAAEHEAVDTACDKLNGAESNDESENLSVFDAEVEVYLHTEEEKPLKKALWEQMNWEYLKEQEAKEAAAREATLLSSQNCSADMLAKQEFAAAVAAAANKAKKEKREKRASEAKKPQTTAEATHNVLAAKRVSSKINYDVLKEIFDEPDTLNNLKKMRTKSYEDYDAGDENGYSDCNEAEVYNAYDDHELF
ncbi:hypothetical protein Ancab_009588 [Ancistrocladus abbreviatus]